MDGGRESGAGGRVEKMKGQRKEWEERRNGRVRRWEEEREIVNEAGRLRIENGGQQGGRNGERGGKGKWKQKEGENEERKECEKKR